MLKTHYTSLICLFVFTLIPVLASAQATEENVATGGVFSGTSSTFSTVIGMPLTSTGGIVLLIVLLTKESSAQLENYLNQGYEDVHASLRIQDPELPATQDLAFLFGVSPTRQTDFARLLVSEREHLAPLLADDKVSSEEAYAFALHIAESMQAHPTLCEDVQRQLDAHYERQQVAQ